MTVEVGMPVYRPSARLEAVLTALALQTDRDFFVTIYNNTSPEEIEEIKKTNEIVELIRKKYSMQITLIQNECNLGCMKNIRQIFNRATGDILLFLADDDIISVDCIELLRKAFEDNNVGCVSRPYYWFIYDFKKPVRYCGIQYDKIQKVSFMNSPEQDVIRCIEATGQISGLAFRTSLITSDMIYKEDMFTSHVYPFMHIFKDYLCAYMPHPTVAVSITTSQCQNDIYNPSPMKQWIDLYRNAMPSEKYKEKREKILENHMLKDFYGFAQIKNYGTYKELWTEICNYVKFRKCNLLNVKFYIFAFGSLLIPRFILRRLTNLYKETVLAKKLSGKVDFNLFPFESVVSLWHFPAKNENCR